MMQTVLIILLFILVAALSALLYARIRREKNERTALELIRSDRFSEILRASIREGSPKDVTTFVSGFLQKDCGCRQIIFLKIRDKLLEPEFCRGVAEPLCSALRGDYSIELGERLAVKAAPESVARILDLLSPSQAEALAATECDLYFPIFWGGQLYGLYLVAGADRVRLPALRLAIASVSEMLALGSRMNSQWEDVGPLQRRMQTMEVGRRDDPADAAAIPTRLFKLIRHRRSETLVGKIVDEVSRDLQLSRYVFLFPGKDDDDSIQIHGDGGVDPLDALRRHSFDRMLARLDPERVEEVATIGQADGSTAPLAERLQKAGLKYVAAFPLSAGRSGLLAWDDARGPQEVFARLRKHRQPAGELMANAESFEKVEGLSYTDALTGLANQRFFIKRLEEEVDRARRYTRSLALIIFDLDELKAINDSYGHQAGDSVLRQMGQILQSSIRSIDVVARYGGDEFCIVMPESDRAVCTRFMRRLQQKIAGSRFQLKQTKRELDCTVSQGGAVFPDNADNSEQLIYAADMALLCAKEAGRNTFRLR